MTFNQRAVMHNRRGKLAARQEKKTPTVLPRPTATTTTVPTTTAAVPKPVSASSVSKPAASISTSVSSSLSSSTSSTLPVSISTSSIVTPPTISTIARAKPTSLDTPSSTLSATSSSISTTPASTRGLSTASLISIVGGCIGAIAVICLIVAFFLRRLRKQKTREGFDPTGFRRSANLLVEKDEKAGLRPRPPTMIERRKVHTAHSVMSGTFGRNPRGSDQASTGLSAPLSLYGNSDDEHGHPQSYAHYGSSAQSHGAPPPPPLTCPGGYSGIPGAYGVPPPLAPVQHEHAGYGAPPIPGTYGPGAYAAYGSDPRYPYQHQHQGYPQFSPYHQHAQQHQTPGYAARNPQPPIVTVGPASPNPFVNSPTMLLGTSFPPVQSSGAPPAYFDEDDSRWAAARNDVKRRSVSNDVDELAAGSNLGSTAATPAPVSPVPEATADASSDVRAKPNSTGPRPTSTYTLYDHDDAYGGM